MDVLWERKTDGCHLRFSTLCNEGAEVRNIYSFLVWVSLYRNNILFITFDIFKDNVHYLNSLLLKISYLFTASGTFDDNSPVLGLLRCLIYALLYLFYCKYFMLHFCMSIPICS